MLEPFSEQKGGKSFTDSSLQWAFAGRSRITNESKNDKGVRTTWHNVWDHWVDSQSDELVSDEGDMSLREDGTVLEEGVNIDPTDGSRQKYEELWEDLPIEAMGKKGNRSSIVVRHDDSDNGSSGLVVKVGGYCQGILKKDRLLTVERWVHQAESSSSEAVGDLEGDDSTRTRNDWIRVFKIGSAKLPCETVCSRTDGKLGNNSIKDDDGCEWKAIEEYYF